MQEFVLGKYYPLKQIPIREVDDAVKVLSPFCGYRRERMIVVHVTATLMLRGFHIAAVGTMTNVQFEPLDVFRPIILEDTKAFILAHNHPDEVDPLRSYTDIGLTEDLGLAGRVLKIPLVDHFVLGEKTAFSFRKNGEGGFAPSSRYGYDLVEFGKYTTRQRPLIDNTITLACGRRRKKRRR